MHNAHKLLMPNPPAIRRPAFTNVGAASRAALGGAKRRPRLGRPTSHGFTLIELLISVSIISMLLALIVPAVMQARATARRTVCQSNLRQWALAVRMHADNYRGRLPYRGQGIKATTSLANSNDWFNALAPYVETPSYYDLTQADARPQPGVGSVWMCPDAEPLAEVPALPFDPKTYFAYGMNMALSTPYMGRPDHIDRLGELQTLVFMADGIGAYCSVIPHVVEKIEKDADLIYNPIPRHAGRTVNIAFMDGRVESYTGTEVGCGSGDPQRPDIRWFPPNSTWPGPPK